MLFVYGYGWGGRGIMSLYGYKGENEQLRRQIADERQALQRLTDEVVAWKEDPFYREKYAREQLHMARPDEVIYT